MDLSLIFWISTPEIFDYRLNFFLFTNCKSNLHQRQTAPDLFFHSIPVMKKCIILLASLLSSFIYPYVIYRFTNSVTKLWYTNESLSFWLNYFMKLTSEANREIFSNRTFSRIVWNIRIWHDYGLIETLNKYCIGICYVLFIEYVYTTAWYYFRTII